MTTQPSRLVEATQFTIQDYEVFKTGTAFDNKFRQAAMELMKKDEENPKSELNKLGLKEVKRIRVLRDASDTEGTNLKLVYETKTDRRELDRKAFQVEQQKTMNLRYTYPVWIADAKGYLKQLFKEYIDWLDATPGTPKDVASALEVELKKVEESRLDSQELNEVRVAIYKLLNFFCTKEAVHNAMAEEEAAKVKAENDIKSELFLRLDFLASALNFIPKTLFDKASFLTHAKTLTPPPARPKGNFKGKPQKNEKPQSPPQNRQHREPKAAEKPQTQV